MLQLCDSVEGGQPLLVVGAGGLKLFGDKALLLLVVWG